MYSAVCVIIHKYEGNVQVRDRKDCITSTTTKQIGGFCLDSWHNTWYHYSIKSTCFKCCCL